MALPIEHHGIRVAAKDQEQKLCRRGTKSRENCPPPPMISMRYRRRAAFTVQVGSQGRKRRDRTSTPVGHGHDRCPPGRSCSEKRPRPPAPAPRAPAPGVPTTGETDTGPPARRICGRCGVEFYNHVRPHSVHGGLTPNAVRRNPAAGRLRNPDHLRRPAAIAGAADAISTQGLSQ